MDDREALNTVQECHSQMISYLFIGTLQVVSWIRLHTPKARGPGFNPWSGNEDPTYHD